MFSFFLGFLLGATWVIAMQAFLAFLLFRRLLQKKYVQKFNTQMGRELDPEQSLDFLRNKQGAVWVLEPEKIPKLSCHEGSHTNVCKEQKCRKDVMEVFPIKMYAKLKEHTLILTDQDGSQTVISLTGCTVKAVSASDLASRKWVKRYPIRIENGNCAIYHASNFCFIYLETSWEKESWCKALRVASCLDKQMTDWYAVLHKEFQQYVASLIVEYPLFFKPSKDLVDLADKGSNKAISGASFKDGGSSKVRLFLKKLAKRASKVDNGRGSVSSTSPLLSKERDANRNKYMSDFINFLVDEKSADSQIERSDVPGCHMQSSIVSDTDNSEAPGSDEGILSLNLLISRLFFDAKRCDKITHFIQTRIQKALSNMRAPSYIGKLSCANLNIGDIPPYIRNARILPIDIKESWGLEVDLEYSGGFMLDVSLRLEVREHDFYRGVMNPDLDPTSGEVIVHLLKDFENYGDESKFPADNDDMPENNKVNPVELDAKSSSKNISWRSAYATRLKALLSSISDQVSQVPLTLSIKVTSLRGTLRLHVKPPPSDQLWFGFTSMPLIDWALECAVGNHKINNDHIAMLIGNRLKAAINEAIVLPNCETLRLPWMLAEKDDWVPRYFAPYIWARQDATDSFRQNAEVGSSKQSVKCLEEVGRSSDSIDAIGNAISGVATEKCLKCPDKECTKEIAHSTSSVSAISEYPASVLLPVLSSEIMTENGCSSIVPENPVPESKCLSQALVLPEQLPVAPPLLEEDSRTKKSGRVRMMDFKKKMGEKLEEKKRHLEEKGRQIVEKMREIPRPASDVK